MDNKELRDSITVVDENGVERDFAVEALFDMEDKTYAMLKASDDNDETFVMEVEENKEGQYLVEIRDQDKLEMILDAYEIAVEENPAD